MRLIFGICLLVVVTQVISCRKEALDPEHKIPENTGFRVELEEKIRVDLQSLSYGLKQAVGIVEVTKLGFERFGEGKKLVGSSKFDAIESFEFPVGNLSFQQTDVAGSFEYQMNGNLMFQQRFAQKYEVAVIYQGSLRRSSFVDQPVISSSNLLFKVSSPEEDLDFQLFNDQGAYQNQEVGGGSFSVDLQQFSSLIDQIVGASEDPFRITGNLDLKNNGYRVEGAGENVRVGNSEAEFAFHEFEFKIPFKNSDQQVEYQVAGNLRTQGVALGLMEFRKLPSMDSPEVNYEFY